MTDPRCYFRKVYGVNRVRGDVLHVIDKHTILVGFCRAPIRRLEEAELDGIGPMTLMKDGRFLLDDYDWEASQIPADRIVAMVLRSRSMRAEAFPAMTATIRGYDVLRPDASAGWPHPPFFG